VSVSISDLRDSEQSFSLDLSGFIVLEFQEDKHVRQVTQGVGHGCHESIDDANYGGDLATYMRK
jgi:hypothetical protein